MGSDDHPRPRALWMKAEAVVHASLVQLDRGGPAVCVPGLRNKALVGFIGLLPRRVISFLIGRRRPRAGVTRDIAASTIRPIACWHAGATSSRPAPPPPPRRLRRRRPHVTRIRRSRRPFHRQRRRAERDRRRGGVGAAGRRRHDSDGGPVPGAVVVFHFSDDPPEAVLDPLFPHRFQWPSVRDRDAWHPSRRPADRCPGRHRRAETFRCGSG